MWEKECHAVECMKIDKWSVVSDILGKLVKVYEVTIGLLKFYKIKSSYSDSGSLILK